jgi:hypothetical protein
MKYCSNDTERLPYLPLLIQASFCRIRLTDGSRIACSAQGNRSGLKALELSVANVVPGIAFTF